MSLISRRLALSITGAAVMTAISRRSVEAAQVLPEATVYRAPGCGCCEVWGQRMSAAGFAVTLKDDPALEERRATLGVPAELAGCHIALIGGHVFEGHVPPADIVKFLGQKSSALGLSVPGMPMGSPGMDMGGESEPYDVLMFTADGRSEIFARH